MNSIKVLIVDDHNLFRAGIRTILSRNSRLDIVGEADNGAQAVIQASKHKPDVILLDYEMPQFDGVSVASKIMREIPESKILMVSMHDKNPEAILSAIEAGVLGFISKDSTLEEFSVALETIHKGENYFKGEISALITPHLIANRQNKTISGRYNLLSKRETEIAKLVSEGYKSNQIADKLYISQRTVEVHKSNILKKIKGSSTADIVRFAITNKLIDL